MTADVNFVQVTPEPEKLMAYIARVSNPENQENESIAGLLKYCIRENHWSVFEHSFMTLEINTSLAIATQILRHRSFTFQQFSQRYAGVELLSDKLPVPSLRRQDEKNRQNSVDDLNPQMVGAFQQGIRKHFDETFRLYSEMIRAGVAKECARFVLPQNTMTRLYMSGSCRNWIHYIELRAGHGTQREHMVIAAECKKIFCEHYPTVAEALEWIIT